MQSHAARVMELQVELFCEDLAPPEESVHWSDVQLAAFFERGGDRPPPMPHEQALRRAACAWPSHAPPPPANAAHALDTTGQWGAEACGVKIHQCDDPRKGRGVFATRRITTGEVVGVYWGELLSIDEYRARHVDSSGLVAAACERTRRLGALRDGAPIGGAGNSGAYCVALVPHGLEDTIKRDGLAIPCYIDAEDPMRSSWPRYINHASDLMRPTSRGSADISPCNLELKVDGFRCLAWLEARRDVEPGEELCFDYGPRYASDSLLAT